MRFYIATGLVNAEHARKAAEVLRRNGHEQTYDWRQPTVTFVTKAQSA